jgi:hypothetical protein
MKRIKPFERPGYTMFNNCVLDHIMPDLSSSAWKVICVAVRQTIGWVDRETESGRKEKDRISYSQFLEKTGLGSSATVSKGIKECLEKGYLLREPSAEHKQAYDYRLNMGYEMDVPETTSETEEVGVETTSETEEVGVETTSETEEVGVETTSVSEDTKERLKKGERKKFLSSPLQKTDEDPDEPQCYYADLPGGRKVKVQI